MMISSLKISSEKCQRSLREVLNPSKRAVELHNKTETR
jgi:hypothetical protein